MATYTKNILLEEKVFSWENILDILDVISKSTEHTTDAEHCISVTCKDDFNVKYDSMEEFRNSKINNYNILRVCYVLQSSMLDVELHLHTDLPCLAEIKISGSEEQQVYALAEKIKDIKKLIKPQHLTYLTKKGGIKAGELFCLISFFIFVVARSFFIAETADTISIGIAGIAIAFLSVKFANWICGTYPVVEFDFIPDWKNSVKKRRSQIKWWFSAVLLPLILAAALDLIKLLWQHRGG